MEEILYTTDLEGPLTLNDNAYELSKEFLDKGDHFFSLISKYDDVLADIVEREGYNAGNTLKLILPFFKAFGINNEDMENFSKNNIQAVKGSKKTLDEIGKLAQSFIISTSYKPYVEAVCKTLDFPSKNTYCTEMDLDKYKLNEQEKDELKKFYRKIIQKDMIEIPEPTSSLEDFKEKDKETIDFLDEIFFEKIKRMNTNKIIEEVTPIGGEEKAKALRDSIEKTGIKPERSIYVGDSITDVQGFNWIKEKEGLAIAFNGNRYAIGNADISCISESNETLIPIVKTFKEDGKKGVRKHGKRWEGIYLEADKGVIEKSENLRRGIRGEKIGGLG